MTNDQLAYLGLMVGAALGIVALIVYRWRYPLDPSKRKRSGDA